MFIDARTLPRGATLDTDICIIGAGAAGITMARELAGKGVRVCLLESGGLELDARTQALYEGENTGFPYYPLTALRLRYFGGTTNHWAGACRPLDDLDFVARDWVPESGWPFEKAHLDPYYERAQLVCQLGAYDYAPDAWEQNRRQRLPLPDGPVTSDMYQASPPTRFGAVYRDEVERADNVTTYLNANVVGIGTSTDGSEVTALRVTTFEDNPFTVTAQHYVLATGAVENVRLLLTSNSVHSNGIGNANDLVGRYFMEHLSLPAAVFMPSDPALDLSMYTRIRPSQPDGSGVGGKAFLTLTPDTQASERLLNLRALIDATVELDAVGATSEGLEALDNIASSAGGDLAGHLQQVIADIDSVALYGYRRLFRPSGNFPVYMLYNQMEQAPNPDSRIALIDERDELGMQKVRLHWSFTELDKHTYKRAGEVMAAALGRAGLGRVRFVVQDDETGWPSSYRGLRGSWHQMGTTRMHTDAKRGVVDADSRIHNMANLYVAGSSVFPTSGYTNPTLTIVALAIRLADHLKGQLAKP